MFKTVTPKDVTKLKEHNYSWVYKGVWQATNQMWPSRNRRSNHCDVLRTK